MSVQKIFVYSVKGASQPLYLHGPDNAEPNKLLSLYLEWFNNEFAPDECLSPHCVEDFEFVNSFCPIDFYDEYKELKK